MPAAIEPGVTNYDFASWGGLFAPARTLRDVLMRLNGEIVKALGSEDLRKRFDDMGLVAKASSREEFGSFLVSEMKRWKGVSARKP